MKTPTFKPVFFALTFCLPLMFSTASRANLLIDGDFETGNPAWSIAGNPAGFTFVVNGGSLGPAQSGNAHVAMGSQNCCGTISQSVATTNGTVYDLTYWLESDGQSPNFFDALWNGAEISGSAQSNASAFGWTRFAFSVVGTGNDTLRFQEQNANGFLGLDNVSLTAAAVPEPGSLALLALGLSGVAAFRRRNN